MPEEESEGFVVRDRRRFVNDEPSPEPPAAAVSEPERPAPAAPAAAENHFADDEDPEAGPQELPDVYTVLAMFLGEMRNLAWLRMGLVANPMSGQIERDLPQAKIAIDTAAFLASQLEPAVPAEERLPLRALVSDLQMNFVEQSKRG
jgi:hypothetical protein